MNYLRLIFVLLGLALTVTAQQVNPRALAAQARAETLHAWRGYVKHAWGHDELRPVSKTPHDWYGKSLLLTPVDSLDTLIMLGFKDEAKQTQEFIVKNLSFDQDLYVQNFEITIRHLGALLTCYQLTGDKRLLNLAQDLGTRLLPAFNSPTGIPYRFVNLKTGQVRGHVTNPAEAGTLLIEFGALSKLTRQPVFYDKAKRALVEVYQRRSPLGLVGSDINVETGAWTNTDSHLSGGIDSYYEYLLKCWLLFGDKECARMWRTSIAAVQKHLADEYRGELWYGHADMNTGQCGATTYGALDAFFPATLALSGDLPRARRLQASGFRMWQVAGIEPEEYNYRTGQITGAGYPLRPEIVESVYYLYYYTRDPQYLAMGAKLWADFVKHCRTEAGYTVLRNVQTKEQGDAMPSYVLAETLKYFYLLFAPSRKLDLRRVVLNTEAHPLRKTW